MNKITKVKMASVATTDLYDLQPAEKLIAKHEVLSYLYHCTFGGAQLIIDEGVFCPTLTNASPLLLMHDLIMYLRWSRRARER